MNFRHRYCTAHASGFTLIEIALVLVIIALLIGGILKGLQLVQSSRVRNLAATTTSVQSAYFAFQDRYGHVAGDWNAVDAGNAIGGPVTGSGNDNGRLDTSPGDPWTESNAFWEHLAKAGFINGSFQGTAATEPTLLNGLAPLNVFQWPIIIGRTADYEGRWLPAPAHYRRSWRTGGAAARAGHQTRRRQCRTRARCGQPWTTAQLRYSAARISGAAARRPVSTGYRNGT